MRRWALQVRSKPAPLVVVGAGLAGLAAAHTLRQAGEDVVVLERSSEPGGRVRSHRSGAWLWEEGPHLYSGVSREFLDLADSLGVVRAGASPGAERRFLVHDQRVISVPGSTGEMLSSPLLSVAGRLRLLREPFIAAGDATTESVTDFTRRRMGTEFSARFVEPVVGAMYAADPGDLLARYAFAESVRHEARAGSILKGRMRASRAARREGLRPIPSWSCAGGAAEFPLQLGKALGDALMLNSEVTRIARAEEGWNLHLANGDEMAARGIVVTISAESLGSGLIGGADALHDLAALADLPHARSLTLSLGFRREDVTHPLDGFGMTVPIGEGLAFRDCIFASTIFPERAPNGHLLLTFHLGRRDEPVAEVEPDADIVRRILPQLRQLLGVTAEPCFVARSERQSLIPLPRPGHDRFLTIADALEEECRDIALCGRWRDGLSDGALMAGGGEAARRLRGRLAHASPS